MKKEIERLMDMLRTKYPEGDYDGFVRLVIYSDGSGAIFETSIELFQFDSIEHLVDHLTPLRFHPRDVAILGGDPSL